MTDHFENQIIYWRQKIAADPAVLEQVIMAMLLARSTQAQAESKVVTATQRAEAAEARLGLVERYGADQWRRGNAGKDPQEFDEWRAVQP